MASKLKAVKPKDAEPSKPKILIFGRAGVGKTWGALDFPKCYYIDCEGGANLPHYTSKLTKSGGVYMGVEQGSQDFEEIINQVKALTTEKHDFRTLVIDSISQLQLIEVAKESEKMMRDNKDMTKTYGAEKKPAVAYSRRLVDWLNRLDMNVILISHEKAEWINEKQVGVTFDAWEKFEYLLHLALNIRKQGESRKAFVRKSRLENFPDALLFDWSYEEFAKRYGKDIMESESKPVVLATPEQISEVKRLLEVVKLTDSVKDKWIADNVGNLDEIESDRVKDVIDHLNLKTAPKPPTKEK